MTNQPDRIIIFDTTLRDGEQSPGASLNVEEKLKIARALAKLGVDVIEAGFPHASLGDFEAVNKIAQAVGTENGPTICGLARATERDIKRAGEALQPAYKKRIHTFLATSDIHLEYKLKKRLGKMSWQWFLIWLPMQKPLRMMWNFLLKMQGVAIQNFCIKCWNWRLRLGLPP